jgi:hypothetical protein
VIIRVNIYIEIVEAIAVAVLGSGVVVAVVTAYLNSRQIVVERKRKACADALSDVMAWLEAPYLIRRRTSDEAATLAAIRDELREIQQRLNFHEAWLRFEAPHAFESFSALLLAVRNEIREPIQEAWRSPPTTTAGGMNLGALYGASFAKQIADFTNAARKDIGYLRFWI